MKLKFLSDCGTQASHLLTSAFVCWPVCLSNFASAQMSHDILFEIVL